MTNLPKSQDKHGITQAEAESLANRCWPKTLNTACMSGDFAGRRDDRAGRYLQVTFTMRFEGRRIRIISARDMIQKERAIYEQAS